MLKREYIFISNRKDIVHMRTHVRTYYYHFAPLAPGPVRIVYRSLSPCWMTYFFLYPRNLGIMKYTKLTVSFILLALLPSSSPLLPPFPLPTWKEKKPQMRHWVYYWLTVWLSLLLSSNYLKVSTTNAAFSLIYKLVTLG